MKRSIKYYALVWAVDQYGIKNGKTEFVEIRRARNMKNDLGLDLVTYDGMVHEGKSGQTVCKRQFFKQVIEKYGAGLIEELVKESIEKNGLSPRYGVK